MWSVGWHENGLAGLQGKHLIVNGDLSPYESEAVARILASIFFTTYPC